MLKNKGVAGGLLKEVGFGFVPGVFASGPSLWPVTDSSDCDDDLLLYDKMEEGLGGKTPTGRSGWVVSVSS